MGGIALSWHRWRGIHRYNHEPDLYHWRMTLGFITFWLCKFCVQDRLLWLAKQVTRPRDPETATRIHGGE